MILREIMLIGSVCLTKPYQDIKRRFIQVVKSNLFQVQITRNVIHNVNSLILIGPQTRILICSILVIKKIIIQPKQTGKEIIYTILFFILVSFLCIPGCWHEKQYCCKNMSCCFAHYLESLNFQQAFPLFVCLLFFFFSPHFRYS